MREIHTLLTKRWILRKEDPELYYKLKDSLREYKDFFKNKMGYNVIVNPLMIKVEKIPGKAKSWMGISEFNDQLSYVFLCLVLMFLEEKEPGEQFVFAQIIDFVKNNAPEGVHVDWTIFSQRKKVSKVLRYCVNESIINITDGDDSLFSKDETAKEVLYENTGASKYFMRRFAFDLSEVKKAEDIEKVEWATDEMDRGIIRRHRVYRRLFMEPVVYDAGNDDQDYLYIKNRRSNIEHDVEKYLDGRFHLHRNGAVVLINETNNSDCLPSRKNLSDITLQMCKTLRDKILCGEYERDFYDRVVISDSTWEKIIIGVQNQYINGWTKAYRVMALTQLKKELEDYMESFGLLEVDYINREICILPAIGKIIGDYPEDFYKKEKKK